MSCLLFLLAHFFHSDAAISLSHHSRGEIFLGLQKLMATELTTLLMTPFATIDVRIWPQTLSGHKMNKHAGHRYIERPFRRIYKLYCFLSKQVLGRTSQVRPTWAGSMTTRMIHQLAPEFELCNPCFAFSFSACKHEEWEAWNWEKLLSNFTKIASIEFDSLYIRAWKNNLIMD